MVIWMDEMIGTQDDSKTYYSTKNICYSKETNSLSVEASTLAEGRPFFVKSTYGHKSVYLVSHLTGAEKLFFLDGIDRQNGEHAGWRFAEYDNGKKTGLTLLVIND
jgi:hypothetical protein